MYNYLINLRVFGLKSWDDKRVILSAITSGIRTNWVSAIRRAAGLTEENMIVKPS